MHREALCEGECVSSGLTGLTGLLTPCGAQAGRSQEEEIISEQRAQVLGLWNLGP